MARSDSKYHYLAEMVLIAEAIGGVDTVTSFVEAIDASYPAFHKHTDLLYRVHNITRSGRAIKIFEDAIASGEPFTLGELCKKAGVTYMFFQHRKSLRSRLRAAKRMALRKRKSQQ